MPINIQDAIEKAFEPVFSRALGQALQAKAEALFKKAFEGDTALARKLNEKIEQGFQRFIENGIQWEKKRAGFKR